MVSIDDYNSGEVLNSPGPIVRVSPDELHVQDSEWFEVLYNKGRREKWPRNHKANGSPGSSMS